MQEWQNHDSKLNNEVYRIAWTYLRGNNGFFSYGEIEEKNKCAKPSKFQWVISWKQKKTDDIFYEVLNKCARKLALFH